jgi:hypothetical protein
MHVSNGDTNLLQTFLLSIPKITFPKISEVKTGRWSSSLATG